MIQHTRNRTDSIIVPLLKITKTSEMKKIFIQPYHKLLFSKQIVGGRLFIQLSFVIPRCGFIFNYVNLGNLPKRNKQIK